MTRSCRLLLIRTTPTGSDTVHAYEGVIVFSFGDNVCDRQRLQEFGSRRPLAASVPRCSDSPEWRSRYRAGAICRAWLEQVRPRYTVPCRAVLVTSVIAEVVAANRYSSRCPSAAAFPNPGLDVLLAGFAIRHVVRRSSR
jgi:hypothetical protein